jgi:hypothetical protein
MRGGVRILPRGSDPTFQYGPWVRELALDLREILNALCGKSDESFNDRLGLGISESTPVNVAKAAEASP